MTPEELVLKQFPGRLYITLVEAGAAIGLKRQTCYNLRHKGTFPLPVRVIRRKPVVALTDLIEYMRGGTTTTPPKPKRGPGRPRNADRES